ncbi:MAG: hypothetical protein WBD46_12085 [Acidobacteriaceae bacterium]
MLYGGFLFTGAMAVLLGAVLPRAAAMYRLHDVQSGTLLTVEFATSACGALLVRRRFERTLKTGYALMAAGAVAVAVARGVVAAASIGVFGLGLGMAMTSTSLVIGRVFPTSRGSALSTLNFCWSIGAMACPLLVARWSGTFSSTALCLPIAVLSATLVVLLQVTRLPESGDARAPGPAMGGDVRPIILRFAAIAFLYVGVEATIGGWISTYAMRVTVWKFAGGSLAAGCFWGALLAGRGLTPMVLRRMPEKSVEGLAALGALLGVLLLIGTHGRLLLVTAAVWAGLALAPIYPLTIALFIGRAGETRHAGWVFAMAGFGGAVVPWLTGMVSSGAHSLRIGLLVALGAALAMWMLTLRIPEEMASPLHAPAAGG